jgi:hypothetical protein
LVPASWGDSASAGNGSHRRVELRWRAATLYNSIYRFDDTVLVDTDVYGLPASQNPVLHLRRAPGRPGVRPLPRQLRQSVGEGRNATKGRTETMARRAVTAIVTNDIGGLLFVHMNDNNR